MVRSSARYVCDLLNFLSEYPNKIRPTTGEDPVLDLRYTLEYPQQKKLKPVSDPPNRRRVPYPWAFRTHEPRVGSRVL